MDVTTGAVGDLIAEAVQLVDRRGHAIQPEVLALVRDQLVAAAVSCSDGMLAADASDVLAELDQLLRDIEHDRLQLAS
jgi:hypothetical protein